MEEGHGVGNGLDSRLDVGSGLDSGHSVHNGLDRERVGVVDDDRRLFPSL